MVVEETLQPYRIGAAAFVVSPEAMTAAQAMLEDVAASLGAGRAADQAAR